MVKVLESAEATGLYADAFAVICRLPVPTVPLNTSVFDVVLVFVIEESVSPDVPETIVKSEVETVVANPVDVTTIDAPLFPGVSVEVVEITGDEEEPPQ